MAKDEPPDILTLEGHEVRVTHPSKIVFPEAGLTKRDVVRYYLDVADGAVRGVRDRPFVLKRFVHGATAEAFYQKRAPTKRPAWLRTATLSFPSGRLAEEIVVDGPASLAWVVNLGCIELHPHAIRASDLEHPDELRVDLDPVPGVAWEDVRRVALEVKALLDELGMVGFPKTSGSRGLHVLVRIMPRWGFSEVRRAALALAREIERRAPSIATSKWWKEERRGVFLDYNQNAKDKTTCSAYSVRPLPDARVSAPLSWGEVSGCDPAAFTVATMPARFAELGDLHREIDARAFSLEPLLELAAKDEAEGIPDAPWPPHYPKQATEPSRVAPSRAARPKAAPRLRHPLVVIARAHLREDALAGLERWKARHPDVAARLAPEEILVDTMRGRSSTWTRIRVNLKSVPEAERPPEEAPDPDDEGLTPPWKAP